MLCQDTGHQESVHIELPVDLARDISYLLKAICNLGGNGRIQLDVNNGAVTGTEVTVKRERRRGRSSR